MNSGTARSRLGELLDEIENARLCGPSDDPDEQIAVVYSFRNLLTRLKRAARFIRDDQTRADVQSIEMPDDIYDVYDAKAAIDALVGDIRDELQYEPVPDARAEGDAMDWKRNVNLIFGPLRELAAHGSDTVLRDVLSEGTPEIVENGYDNWNGGTTTYTLSLSVPPHIFVQIEDPARLAAIEEKILDRVKSLTRAETHHFIDTVVVQPGVSTSQRVVPAIETPFWLSGHFKLFISHLSSDKIRATNLRGVLQPFAISAFVAHEDIEPTKEWQVEIEKALFSMDALTAVLVEKFSESKWCDQEIGVALGRGVAVLPIRAGIDPYGLMGKFQGIPSLGKKLGDVAKLVVATLLKNPKTRTRLTQCLVEQLLAAADGPQAATKLDALELGDDLPPDQLVRIRDNAATNPTLYDDVARRRRINALLTKHGVEQIQAKPTTKAFPDDEIPF